MHKSIKPPVAGSVRVTQAKTMATVLVKMKLHWDASFVPRIDHAKLASKKKIVCRDYIEHRRSILRNFHRPHSSVNRTYKRQFHLLGIERAVHGQACTG